MQISGLITPLGLNTQCMEDMDDTGQLQTALDLLELSTVNDAHMRQYIYN